MMWRQPSATGVRGRPPDSAHTVRKRCFPSKQDLAQLMLNSQLGVGRRLDTDLDLQ